MKNTPRIEFAPLFNKQRTAAPIEIKQALRETLELFLENPMHEALRNHWLTEEYAGTWSIDVTADWRALYRKDQEKVTAQVALSMTDQLQATVEKRSRYWPKYARLAR